MALEVGNRDGFATEVSQTDGIGLADLDPITTLLVRTQNSVYQIVVVQPWSKAVLVQGGPFWSSPDFPDGLVRVGKGGFMLGRTSLAEQ